MHNPIAALRAENDMLRERVRQLEAAAREVIVAPPEWGLTPTQTQLLELLLARKVLLHTSAQTILDTGPNAIKVTIYHLRGKLRPHGVTIEARFGEGYYMTQEMKDKVRDAC